MDETTAVQGAAGGARASRRSSLDVVHVKYCVVQFTFTVYPISSAKSLADLGRPTARHSAGGSTDAAVRAALPVVVLATVRWRRDFRAS